MTLNPDIFDQVQELLGSVPVDEAEAHIDRLNEEIRAKQAEQQKWYALLGLKQQLGEAAKSTNGHRAPKDIPPLRRAVRVLFEERAQGSTLAIGDLRDEMRQRGWLGDTKGDTNRLYMTVSNMVKSDELFRPTRGLYQLPPNGPDQRGGDQEQGGEVVA